MIIQKSEFKTVKFNNVEKWFDAFVFIANLFLQVCLLFLALFLAYQGVRYSYYNPAIYGSWSKALVFFTDRTSLHILIFIIVLASFTGTYFVFRRDSNWKAVFDSDRWGNIFLVISCLLMLAAGFLYVNDHPYYPIGDQINTAQGSVFALEDNYIMFTKGGYIGLYEQQKGLLFLYEIIFSVFGNFNFAIIAKMHVLCNTLTLIFGNLLIKEISGKTFCRNLYCLFVLAFLPYFIYLPFAYGDLPSIALSMIMFWALVKFGKSMKFRYVIVAAVAITIALLFRTNIWIVIIAAAIGIFVMAFEKRNRKPIIAMLCVIALSSGGYQGVIKMYEIRSGLESGIGLPSVLWVGMGLQETEGVPGTYNRYQQNVFEQCDMNPKAASEIAWEYIGNRIQEFKDNPAMAGDFFLRKLQVQWMEPTFGAIFHTKTAPQENMRYPYNDLYYGQLHNIVWRISNYYQSMIYLAFLLYVISQIMKTIKQRRSDSSMAVWIPAIAVLGGFLFSLMWESGGRYILPYFVNMLPYAAIGLGETAMEGAGIFIKKNNADRKSL